MPGVLNSEQVAAGRVMLKWNEPGFIEVQEYIVVNSAVMPPKLLRNLELPNNPL